MNKEALLVLDMLNDFVLPGSPLEVPDTRKILPAIQQEIEEARAAGRPIVYVCDSHDPDDKEFSRFGWPAHGVTGTKGAEVVDALSPCEEDTIIRKKTYSAFYHTDLDRRLRELGVNGIRLTGTVTHICVLFTALEAVQRDYGITVVENGIAGTTPEDHAAAVRIMKNVLGAKMVRAREPAYAMGPRARKCA